MILWMQVNYPFLQGIFIWREMYFLLDFGFACTGIRIGELCGLKGEILTLLTKPLRFTGRFQGFETPNLLESSRCQNKSNNRHNLRPLFEQFLFPVSYCHFWNANSCPLTNIAMTGTIHYTEPRNVQRRFKSILEKCDLPPVTFHSLRHSFATRCIEKGADSKALSEILGHSSVKITLDIYVHSNMEQKRKYINQMTIWHSFAVKIIVKKGLSHWIYGERPFLSLKGKLSDISRMQKTTRKDRSAWEPSKDTPSQPGGCDYGANIRNGWRQHRTL